MRRLVLALSLSLLAGCGSDTKIAATLLASTSPLLDPYQPSANLAKIRVRADGAGQYDDAVTDFPPTTHDFEIKAPFEEGRVSLRVEGLDPDGNLVAFGRAERADASSGAVDVSFLRNVALVTHRPNPRQDHPAAKVYVVDVVGRARLGVIRLPNPEAVGRDITPRGDDMLVTYEVGGQGFVGLLSSKTAEWSTTPLLRRQDAAFAAPVRPIAVVAGGGALAYVDLDTRQVLKEFEIGGRVLDGTVSADGHRALIVLDLEPGVVIADLTENCTKSFERQERCVVALDVVQRPGGVALAEDGRRAFVVSSVDGSVVAVDLVTLQVSPFMKGKFPAGVRSASFSSEIQSVLAVQSDTMTGLGRVHTFVVASEGSFSYDDAVQTQLFPSAISSDPSGRRALVVAAGTSSATAGLTVIQTALDQVRDTLALPIGSTYVYPSDPDDLYLDRNGAMVRQRYQPRSIAILNGR